MLPINLPQNADYDARLNELVAEARKNSPFYAELYSGLPLEGDITLSQLPLVDHSRYWASYHDSERTVMTRCQNDGVVLKTGGTTGIPKFTSYSQIELRRTASLLAEGLLHAGLRAGDRVANLFYAGDLYGSFLLHILSIISLPIPAVQIPIGGLMPPASTARLLKTCRVTAVLSTVTSLVQLSSYCRPLNETFPAVKAVMFGGEPMFDDQVAAVSYLFPNATIRSCIYGSIDAGVVAVSARAENPAEHVVLSATAIVEILVEQDGVLTATDEPSTPGTLVVTNLIRDLSPMIRYPTGDRAEWVDKAAGIFRLLGRSGFAVRLGPVSLDISHLRQLARAALKNVAINAFQVSILREDAKDRMEIAIDTSGPPPPGAGEAIIEMLNEQRPMFKEHVGMGLIAPARVCFKSVKDMKINPSSGKLAEMIDLRLVKT
ncbi:AMP-dependent synthetase ligase [Fusarium beomiforme]|uniref:AMP-dependent synthetase ligase n=1 Tax=Fusarium beomiforme TaxID=44412 RepID=A0A9P5AT40_9HYPO|nr:AMP-dependent synthetase ligase [Fusarium beomiforme]